jgi:hypothetical protein
VVTDFPVSDAYDTNGTYQVKLKTPVPDVQPKRTKAAAALAARDFAPTKQVIKGKTSFTVEKGEGRRLTSGPQRAARSRQPRRRQPPPRRPPQKKAAKRRSSRH